MNLSSQISVPQPFEIDFNQLLDADRQLHRHQTVAPNSPSCASPSLDIADTSLTDDPLDNPENLIHPSRITLMLLLKRP